MATRKKKSFKLQPQMLVIIIIAAAIAIVLVSAGTVQTAKFYYAQGQKSVQLPATPGEAKTTGTEAKPAVVVLCQDPDGTDYFTKGACKDANGEYADFCAPLGELFEYSCVTTTADGSGEKTACAKKQYFPAYGKCIDGKWVRGDVTVQ